MVGVVVWGQLIALSDMEVVLVAFVLEVIESAVSSILAFDVSLGWFYLVGVF